MLHWVFFYYWNLGRCIIGLDTIHDWDTTIKTWRNHSDRNVRKIPQCTPNKDSIQPTHPRSLIRVFRLILIFAGLTCQNIPYIHKVLKQTGLSKQWRPLRKHAYSNILKILQLKKENFQIKKLWYFSYFCWKHRLWVLVRTASARRF